MLPISKVIQDFPTAFSVQMYFRVLLEPLLQEEWRHEASNKLKVCYQVRCSPTFQDGKNSYLKRPAEEKQLGDNSRPKVCLLHDPNSHLRQTRSVLLCQRAPLPQFTCLPFSLSCTPWVFTKTLKPVTTMLRELRVRLVMYIDNILVVQTQ